MTIVTTTGSRTEVTVKAPEGKSWEFLDIHGPHTHRTEKGIVIDLIGQPPQQFSISLEAFARANDGSKGERVGGASISVSAQDPSPDDDIVCQLA